MSRDALLLPMKVVTHLTSLSRATIYRRVQAGTFPRPISLGGRRVAFTRTDLDSWLACPAAYADRQAASRSMAEEGAIVAGAPVAYPR